MALRIFQAISFVI